MRRITLISTGGTIEKTYDEHSGSLENRSSVVQEMLGLLRLEDTVINTLQLMHKDSLQLTDADRERIVSAITLVVGPESDPTADEGVVLLHGTDTLCVTGELLAARLGHWVRVPVVLTGAIRPFEMKRSDALQNLTESILSTGVLAAGVWVVAHGRALRFPGPLKDRERGTFRMGGALARSEGIEMTRGDAGQHGNGRDGVRPDSAGSS
jgi:L-asparaginase